MEAKDLVIEKQAAEIKTLKETIKRLEETIAGLEKNSSNSSKPPSSDIVKPKRTVRKVGRKKRKRGGQCGHRKFTRQRFEPEQVDEIIEYEFKDKDKDAKGLKCLDEWFIIQQVVLPKKMYRVVEHRARKYLDPVTGKTYIAAIPDEIRKGGLLGADITAQRRKFPKLLSPRMINSLGFCRISRRLILMRPAIMTMVSCTGRGVLIHPNTACLRLMNLAAVKSLKKCWAKTFVSGRSKPASWGS